MELSSQEGEMPIPINTTYSHGAHIIHHHHDHHMPNNGSPSSLHMEHYNNNNNNKTNSKQAMMIKYKECLKNHAAAMGGNATDGCGEFMPSGEEGTIEALNCSVCNCHRNFHRKEIQGGDSYLNRKIILGHHHKGLLSSETLGYPTGTLISSRPHQMIMSYNMGGSFNNPSDQSDHEQDQEGRIVVGRVTSHHNHHHHHQVVKKRFRTKFTQEQKEKLLNFAEKVGWKIQKQEEGVVQQFCQEIGIKRRVLKVWMHNNKHNLAKKNNIDISSATPINPTTTTSPPTS